MKASNMLKGFAFSLAAIALAAAAPASAADLVMWERSGGNKDMVDKLVEMWNAKHPDRHINLTYIPHAEMVAKLAQAIASGDVPDLMGMDLIYAPQFEKAGQLVDITDAGRQSSRIEDSQSRPHDGRDVRQENSMASRSMPMSRRSSTIRTFSRRRGSIPTSRRRASPNSGKTPTRSRRSAGTSRAITSRAHARAATSSRSAR